MADQCMLGWILATLFVLFAIYCLVIKKKERGTKIKDLLESRSESVNCTATTNEECRSGNVSDADVIIVGAGVAGAALAHTLGKVFSFPAYSRQLNGEKQTFIYFPLVERLFENLKTFFFFSNLANCIKETHLKSLI
jgi:hypothetical protein